MTEPTPEQDVQLMLLNSLLTTPHRALEPLSNVHTELHEADPSFYGKLAVWYAKEGSVRDHQELFVAHLLKSDQEQLREAGFVLLQDLAPYQVARVHSHMKKVLGKVPRSTRTAIERYLRVREADDRRFDRAALRARKHLKGLYASLHIKPSPRANKILFDDDPPEDSLAFAVKRLAEAESPREQAELIITHRIPYPIAVGTLERMTPVVLVALLDAMTPQEVINNLGALKKKGAFDAPEVRALIDTKLEAAKTDSRVAVMKGKVAADAAGLDDEARAKLAEVADARAESLGRIVRSTALFVDKSASMEQAIEIGKRLAALISGACDAELHVVAFDAAPRRITATGGSLSDWEKAFSGIRAGSPTSIGAPLELLRREKVAVEQIILVTDEGENRSPYFEPTLVAYREELGVDPNVVVLQVGNCTGQIVRQLEDLQVDHEALRFEGDYYSLPNVIPLLCRPGRFELLLDILALELPKRADLPPVSEA